MGMSARKCYDSEPSAIAHDGRLSSFSLLAFKINEAIAVSTFEKVGYFCRANSSALLTRGLPIAVALEYAMEQITPE